MYSLFLNIFADAGIPIWAVTLGFFFAALIFIITVLVEAVILKRYFSDLPFKQCGGYSLLANLISLLLGIPIAFLFSNPQVFAEIEYIFVYLAILVISSSLSPNTFISELGGWITLAFVITLISEFFYFKYALESKPISQIVRFTVIANITSYTISVILSFVFSRIQFFV